MTIEYNATATALRDVDNFHKNATLLYKDLIDSVKQGLISKNMITHIEEGNYTIWDASKSGHLRTFLFENNGCYYYIGMLVKVHEDYLKESLGSKFKHLCDRLGRDPSFPLLLWFGKFFPSQGGKLIVDPRCRRDWLLNSILLKLQDEHTIEPGVDKITFENKDGVRKTTPVTISSHVGLDWWWCEKSVSTIIDLLSVTDSNKVSELSKAILQECGGMSENQTDDPIHRMP